MATVSATSAAGGDSILWLLTLGHDSSGGEVAGAADEMPSAGTAVRRCPTDPGGPNVGVNVNRGELLTMAVVVTAG